MIIKFIIYENQPVSKSIDLNRNNIFKVQFYIEKELEYIRQRFELLRDKRIIKMIKNNHKVENKAFKPLVDDLIICRRSLISAQKQISSLKKKFINL